MISLPYNPSSKDSIISYAKKLIGIKMILIHTICRKASSLLNAALKPAIEYEVAFKMRLMPVLPLKGED